MIFTIPIQKALRFSIKTHEVYQKQKRKGKDIAYITHPMTVGMILARAGADEETIIAGILHDTIEDSIPEKKVTRAMIAERFGERVAGIVDDVTEQNRDLSWAERKQEALNHVPLCANASLLVKSADLIANISEMRADYYTTGEEMFERFSGTKEDMLAHYQKMIDAVLLKWPENPLAEDLRTLDLAGMNEDEDPYAGEPSEDADADTDEEQSGQ